MMNQTKTNTRRVLESFVLFAVTFLSVQLMGNPAYADFFAAVDFIRATFQSIGTPIGTIAIMIIGTMAMLGRITWIQALVVATGIAVFVGAANLYGQIAAAGAR